MAGIQLTPFTPRLAEILESLANEKRFQLFKHLCITNEEIYKTHDLSKDLNIRLGSINSIINPLLFSGLIFKLKKGNYLPVPGIRALYEALTDDLDYKNIEIGKKRNKPIDRIRDRLIKDRSSVPDPKLLQQIEDLIESIDNQYQDKRDRTTAKLTMMLGT
ncbi:MAG: hypothetical protein ACFFDN_39955, partial [Candidatus Hodarchaeota archaeon]